MKNKDMDMALIFLVGFGMGVIVIHLRYLI